jgi:hypothetical protein
MKTKQKKFTVYVRVEELYTAEIKADSLREALDIAESRTEEELRDTPGEILNTDTEITGVFE